MESEKKFGYVGKRKECTLMEFCPHANDCEHNKNFYHNGKKEKRDYVLSRLLFNDNNSIRVVEKSDLLPIVKNWKFSSLFPVKGKRGYHFLGWEIQNYTKKTGNVAIYKDCDRFYGVRCETYRCDEIEHRLDRRRLFQPWDDNRVTVYFIPKLNKMMDEILGRKIPECNVSYADILNFLHKKSIPAFIIGGAVRDCVCSLFSDSKILESHQINDIDFSFGTSSEHLVQELRNEFPLLPISTSRYGLVVIGPAFSEHRMEGKCSNGMNTARRRLGSIPRVVGTNLFHGVMGRDFTINSLIYDHVNGVTVDPTARNALYDCYKKNLRICIGKHPLTKNQKKRDFWIIGNPLNIQRYHRFVKSGFSPSNSTEKFILQAEKEWDVQDSRFFVVPRYLTQEELVEKSQKAD